MKRALDRPSAEALPPCEWSDDDEATPRRKATKANPERAPTRSVPRLQAVGRDQLTRAYHRIDNTKESVRVVIVTLDPRSVDREGTVHDIDPSEDVEWDSPHAAETRGGHKIVYRAGDDEQAVAFAGMSMDEVRGIFVRGVDEEGVADDVLDHLVKIGDPVNFVIVVDGGDGDVARLVAHAAVKKAERRLSEGTMHPSGRIFLEELKREMRADSLGYAQQPTRPRLRELLHRAKRAGSATAERSAVREFLTKHISEL